MIKPIFMHKNMETGKWIVAKAEAYDHQDVDTSWMCDEKYGEQCRILGISILDNKDVHILDTEEEAIRLVAKLYAAQLGQSTLKNILKRKRRQRYDQVHCIDAA